MPTPQAAVQVPSLQLVPKPPRRSHKWRWIIGLLSFIVVALVIGARILISRAEPILRAKIVETLSARFHSRVELGDLHVSVTNGLRVEGTGLKIFGVTDPNPFAPGVQPLIDVREFDFRADVNSLLRQRAHISTVYVNGLAMNIPPKGERKQIDKLQGDEKIKIVVDQLVCADAKLVINTAKPEKPPLEFDIKSLVMTDVGPGRPMPFVALLTNPKPVGDIQSAGVFGPLEEENIRETAVRGTYSFTNADLGPLKGIAGILSSEGKYSGVLGRIEVDGETDTPDFSLEVSGHHVPLHTVFHAWVDGTDGDTYLQPVKASFLRSSFTAKGKVVRMKSPAGHDIELQVVMDRAFVEDLLKLGVKTDPALMSGPVAMKASLSIRPGEGDIASRLKLAGDFHVRDGRFSSDKIQDRLDAQPGQTEASATRHRHQGAERSCRNVPSGSRRSKLLCAAIRDSRDAGEYVGTIQP